MLLNGKILYFAFQIVFIGSIFVRTLRSERPRPELQSRLQALRKLTKLFSHPQPPSSLLPSQDGTLFHPYSEDNIPANECQEQIILFPI